METQKTSANNISNAVNGGDGEGAMGDGAMYGKVMTDEQVEDLRRQIAAYATICEQLVEMHKDITTRNDSLAGMRLGNLYCDPLMTSGSHRIAARQRWNPTPVQLQILEGIFKEGTGTPTKQKIKEITRQLSEHGQISETNVYNWFQNRRARLKRKHPALLLPNNSESEAEAEVESPYEKKARSQKMTSNGEDDPSYNNVGQPASDMKRYTGKEFPTTLGMSPTNSKSSGSLGQMSFYENVLLNPRMEQYMEKIELHGSYSPFQSAGSYDLSPL